MKNTTGKIPVGILGATGMVGQRLILLLRNHPWFEVVCVAASKNSAGKRYVDAVNNRWSQKQPIPEKISDLIVSSVELSVKYFSDNVRLIFSAFEANKESIKKIEESYASSGLPVVSNNSAHRWTEDIPMIIPEINPEHLAMIEMQKKNRGWGNGFIVTKPNCSIQSYAPLLYAWKKFEPKNVMVSTYQAISGAGKTFGSWPEMVDNVIPYIGGEEKKSENEPLRILGNLKGGKIFLNPHLNISASCIRVPVSDGHMTSLSIRFNKEVEKDDLVLSLRNFQNPLTELYLPSAPSPFITYFEEEDRPQTRLDRDLYNGMGISVGRIRKDPVMSWKCVSLSHNTIRGAAGGSVLNAELLLRKGYIN